MLKNINNLIKYSLIFSVIMLTVFSSDANAQRQSRRPVLDVSKITLPDGFKIEIYAKDVPNARAMALTPSGILFVGSRRSRVLTAVIDSNNDFKADKVIEVDRDLFFPTGIAFKNGTLYVAEVNQIVKYENIENTYDKNPTKVVVYDKLSDKTHHGWKYLDIGPDGKLYFDIGAPSNADMHELPFATMARINTDGTGFEHYVYGVRHSVGFDWDPRTDEMWFTDNGRDNWFPSGSVRTNDIPPDELNHVTKQGEHFGFPYYFGTDLKDPRYGNDEPLSKFTPTAMNLAPHAAALGMKFYTGNMFPAEYKNHIFIAEHGSWNINGGKPYNGNRITLVKVENNKAVSYETFADGWLVGDGRSRMGRPVDIEIMPDGSMLVSDDYANVIYRISYNK